MGTIRQADSSRVLPDENDYAGGQEAIRLHFIVFVKVIGEFILVLLGDALTFFLIVR